MIYAIKDITIKISDEGGGISRSSMTKVWTYMYTTAKTPVLDPNASHQNDFKAPMAGFGYGLPLSRLYARYLLVFFQEVYFNIIYL